MCLKSSDEWICRAHCPYYKPNRIEDERCRGFDSACLLVKEGRSLDLPATAPLFDPNFKKSFLRANICRLCPFFVDDCDFTSSDPPPECIPCGGLILLSRLLRHNIIEDKDIRHFGPIEPEHEPYLSLTPRCAIKRLEEDYLYHIEKDELYEVNEEAVEMLLNCDGTHKVDELKPDPEFLEFCLDEDLLEFQRSSQSTTIREGQSPVPSLRYLEWLVTFRCNLSCTHCYLGEARASDFPESLIRPLLEQFSTMQGLRIMVSGGEPTVYKHFQTLNDAIKDYPIRSVLLSNGLLLSNEFVKRLHFHEVQISLDGMERGHDMIRGLGSYKKAVSAMRAVQETGLDLSIATMIHTGNIQEWDDLKQLVADFGPREWSIDYPCVKGRWESHPELAVAPEVAAEKMRYAFGGSYHGTSPGWTCGRHLAAVLPNTHLCRCGLYQEQCYGSVEKGLVEAWKLVEHIPIRATECAKCSQSEVCGGGCRFRAGGSRERDEVMCRLHGEWI